MLVFIRSQLSSFISTLVDFWMTIAGVELLRFGYVTATVLGAACGAICNFILGRLWVFKAKEGKLLTQVPRYFIVWMGSVALNALGMFLLTDLVGIQYIWSKAITSLIVGIGYNFILQKRLVFPTT